MKAGTSINQSAIAKSLHVSSTAVAKSLPLLEKEGLILYSVSPRMNLTYIEFNRDNRKAVAFKRAENLKIIYESDLLEFLDESFPGTTIILFGSYSYGEDTTESDIDLAIIGVKEKPVDLETFNKKLERDVSLNFYDSFKVIDKNLRNNLLNGIVVAGGISL